MNLFAVLRLIRSPNLFIVALTQWLVYGQVILPALSANHIQPGLDEKQRIGLILVTVILTAGGYIINDLVDEQADLLNGRVKMFHVLEDKRYAWWLYLASQISGFCLAFYLALSTDNRQWIWFYPASVWSLYFYSVRLKRTVFLGNFLIALFCAGVAAVIWFAERRSLVLLEETNATIYHRFYTVILFYLGFAFLSTLFREMIKDLEDENGDRAAGFKTSPVLLGVKKAKWLTLLVGLVFFGLFNFSAFHLNGYFHPRWFFLLYGLVDVLLLVAIFQVFWASESRNFKWPSALAKIVMALGILLLFALKTV